MDDRREQPERDRQPPHQLVAAGGVVDHAAEPDADERADLVREEHEPEQHADVARAEHQRHQPGGQRHGRQPQQADHDREHDHHERRRRHDQEQRERDRAREVDPAEQVLAAPVAAEHARAVGADHVEEADQRDRRRRQAAAEPEVGQVGRQVRRDERDVEAADEEAGGQQLVAAVRERAADRLPDRDLGLVGRLTAAGQREREDRHQHERARRAARAR